MRIVPALVALSAMAFASAAFAGPVSITPIKFSDQFQTNLDHDLGVREGDYLRQSVERAVGNALARRGATIEAGAPVTIDIEILDADPNKPTMQQLSSPPYPDYSRSVSVGGAELHAVIRGGDGQVLDEISHRRYDYSLTELEAVRPVTWTAAERAISEFANEVADSYLAHAG